jgi:N-acetylmuramoyl-L-alanine amidase
MVSRRLTRRSLLAAAAGTMAGGLIRPGGALAALGGPPRPRLSQRWVGAIVAGETTIALGAVADLVGVEWQHPDSAGLQLRFRDSRGPWSHWVSAAAHGHGPEDPSQAAGHIGEPIWMGGATVLQLRTGKALQGLRLHLIDVSNGVGARGAALAGGPLALAAALSSATPVLDAGAGQPPIIARRGWAQGVSHPRVAPEYGDVRMAFVHHTENPNGYSAGEVPAMLRAIYAFHRYVNGWNDIGYNFVIDLYGRIFEARAGGIDEPVVGAHAGGYNLVSSGVAILGSFMSVPISTAARASLERLLAWKLSLHGLPSQGKVTVRVNPAGAIYSRFPANAHVPLPRIAGHRDGDSTDCPGNVLYGELPVIRTAVAQLAARSVRATLALGTAEAPATTAPATPGAPAALAEPSAPAATTAPIPILVGALSFLDGTPIAGATVLLQARIVSRKGEVVSEQTIAEALTDAQGHWSLPTTLPNAPSGALWLRALCVGAPGYGAAVSPPLRASLTPAQAPAPTPPAAAPPAP